MKKLVLVRHGQSIWNLENKFTGWTDVELSEKGIVEAQKAGQILKENGFVFDVAYTSVLKRAIDTLKYILEEMHLNIPIYYSYKLNERHYGALQGLNKDEMRKKYGKEQVQLWRRSVSVRPPALEIDDERYPGNDSKYQDLSKEEIPLTENLADTSKRVIDYWHSDIEKMLLKGEDDISSILVPAMFVKNTAKVSSLFNRMKKSRNMMAVVLNDERHLIGIIAMEDLLEELVGEIEDEQDDEDEEEGMLDDKPILTSGMAEGNVKKQIKSN